MDAHLGRWSGRHGLRLGERRRQAPAELSQPRSPLGGDGNRLAAGRLQSGAHRRPLRLGLGQVLLGDDQGHRPLEKRRIVVAQLGNHRLPGGDRIGRRAVDHPHQDAGALDVAQELVSQPAPLVGALDQAGQVCDHGAPLVVELEDAQVGADGGEGVGADRRRRRGERRQQGRFPGIGCADQPDVGDQLQLELDPALLARLSLLGMRRSPMGGRGEMDVAAPAATAVRDHQPGTGSEQLADPLAICSVLARRADHGPGRDRQRD